MTTKAKFDELKAEIDSLYAKSLERPSAHFNLVQQALSRAEDALFQATTSRVAGRDKECRNSYHSAQLYWKLAQGHNQIKVETELNHKFSGHAQIAVSELAESLLQFKHIVEWKNCPIRIEIRQGFVECAELLEDALNELRLAEDDLSERTAVGALLLLFHLSCVVFDEHDEFLPLCKGIKSNLNTSANAILVMVENLRKLNQLKIKYRVEQEPFKSAWKNCFRKSEESIVSSIGAFVHNNEDERNSQMQEFQLETSALRNILNNYRSAQDPDTDSLDVAGQINESAALSPAPNSVLASTDEFLRILNAITNSLSGRVEDDRQMQQRLTSIKKLYSELMLAHQAGRRSEARVLVDNLRFEAQQIRLMYKQAQLFSDSGE